MVIYLHGSYGGLIKTKAAAHSQIIFFPPSPVGLFPSVTGGPPEHGQGSLEQHDHS